jgi:hypothetical protein
MAAKKKNKKKLTKLKKSARKKPVKKTRKGRPAKRKISTKRKAVAGMTRVMPATSGSAERSSLGKDVTVVTAPYVRKGLGARSGGQSGDLQGLSNLESAGSESVDELLEEGNAFEAEIVKGVEDAGDADEREVHSHEVPENDVPGEYLEKD